MRALVTGISGFVGGHLTEYLVAQGDVVVGLSASGRWPLELEHLGKSARIERFDLADCPEGDLAGFVTRKQPEVVYHLAAQSNPQESLSDPRSTWALNLGGTLNLLEAVKISGQRPRVILVGSGVCYGNPAPEWIPVRENCPLRPNNPYAASKAAADLLGVQHYLAHGTDVVIVRPFNHAGPRQSPRYVLAALALQVAEIELGRRDCLEVGNLDVIRDFTDVRDVACAYRLLARNGRPGEIYNLGSGQGTRIANALEHLRSLAAGPVPVRVEAGRVRSVDQPLLVADPSKLVAATGWQPRYTIEQTLADMLDFYRKARSHQRLEAWELSPGPGTSRP
jgi:GDP-4-dehydro-6-deoxy-D-mannose reductase